MRSAGWQLTADRPHIRRRPHVGRNVVSDFHAASIRSVKCARGSLGSRSDERKPGIRRCSCSVIAYWFEAPSEFNSSIHVVMVGVSAHRTKPSVPPLSRSVIEIPRCAGGSRRGDRSGDPAVECHDEFPERCRRGSLRGMASLCRAQSSYSAHSRAKATEGCASLSACAARGRGR